MPITLPSPNAHAFETPVMPHFNCRSPLRVVRLCPKKCPKSQTTTYLRTELAS